MSAEARGFTLIELMIVVAIIAILASIALPVYRDYTSKAKIATAVASVGGDKIKVGENYGAGKAISDYCTRTAATSMCTASATGVVLTGRAGPTVPDTTVMLTGTFPADFTGVISWACEVAASPTPRFVGADCDDLP